ncbi:hypothetical protein KUTeg_010679 [Tegillarca granosa]|uniref:Uncharacterized protein n=1 Tax=Tegillarca granosa TaxID=220873 RepID=A0ABQ9F1W0_TEGGR|nr:hypothetical protein KUTeg_010679 [Tegillarca granosa]
MFIWNLKKLIPKSKCVKGHLNGETLLCTARKTQKQAYMLVSVSQTICDHSDGNVHMDCLNRNCISCGVEFLKLQPEENDISDDAPKVQWNKYEYVEINGKKENKSGN